MSAARGLAVVTGASKGMGAACATALVEQGYDVVGVSRSAPADPRVRHAHCDLAVTAQRRDLIEQLDPHGRLTVIVFAAGITSTQLLMTRTVADATRVWQVNLLATADLGSQSMSRLHQSGGRGRLIAVSSMGGFFGSGGVSDYSAAKTGLVGLVRSWARDLGADATANVLAPGLVETDMLGELTGKAWRYAMSSAALDRVGNTLDVTAALQALLDNSAINGVVLPVAGGFGLGA